MFNLLATDDVITYITRTVAVRRHTIAWRHYHWGYCVFHSESTHLKPRNRYSATVGKCIFQSSPATWNRYSVWTSFIESHDYLKSVFENKEAIPHMPPWCDHCREIKETPIVTIQLYDHVVDEGQWSSSKGFTKSDPSAMWYNATIHDWQVFRSVRKLSPVDSLGISFHKVTIALPSSSTVQFFTMGLVAALWSVWGISPYDCKYFCEWGMWFLSPLCHSRCQLNI